MPGRDQTGPNGLGPFTGRGLGLRRGYGFRDGFHYGYGRGAGFGRGYGRGYGLRRNYYEDEPAVSQKTFLENELRIMKEQVAELEKQLRNLE